jgi:hypothetical protein
MADYGFFGDVQDRPKLSAVDSAEKARAFLRLLDLTIGAQEGSVIPYDLSLALDQIRQVALALEDAPAYRRLSAAARRQ